MSSIAIDGALAEPTAPAAKTAAATTNEARRPTAARTGSPHAAPVIVPTM